MYTVVTHDGGFHADDVFGVAALQLKFGVDAITVIRTRDQATIDAADIVLDVGGVYDVARNRFDHHQLGAPVRENGVPYAAFGLIWKTFGAEICGSDVVAEKIDGNVVQAIDAGDNGFTIYTLNEYQVRPYDLDSVIASYLPPLGSDQSPDDTFFDAVTFARQLLERLISRAHAKEEMRRIAEETYDSAVDKALLVCDVPMSSSLFIEHADVMVLVGPGSEKDHVRWSARAIPIAKGEWVTRVQFPLAWAGLSDTELAETSGIHDAIFCHKNRHLFICKTREGAIKAATIALGRDS